MTWYCAIKMRKDSKRHCLWFSKNFCLYSWKQDTAICWCKCLFQNKSLRSKFEALVVIIEFFTVYTKLAEMAFLASKDLTTAKKVTSSGAQPDARDYYRFRSPVPYQLSFKKNCKFIFYSNLPLLEKTNFSSCPCTVFSPMKVQISLQAIHA